MQPILQSKNIIAATKTAVFKIPPKIVTRTTGAAFSTSPKVVVVTAVISPKLFLLK